MDTSLDSSTTVAHVPTASHQGASPGRIPGLIGAGEWTDADQDKRAVVKFEGAEPNSFVHYSVELYPPVEKRASFFLEQVPGQMLQLFASLNPQEPPREEHVAAVTSFLGGGRAQGRGGVRLIGHTAHLAVVLEEGTVPVTARVYMHAFEVEDKPMSWQNPFDSLLKAMAKGDAPSARKSASSGRASDAEPPACSSDTQTPPDTSGDASR